MTPAARRHVLERYVLGTLEEDARAVLRGQVIADPNVCAEVREVELDLLDAAARNMLADAAAPAPPGARGAYYWTQLRVWPALALWLAVALALLSWRYRP